MRQATASRAGTLRYPRLKLLVWLGLCVLPAMGGARAWLALGHWQWLAAYLVASAVVLGLYGYDKRQARRDQRRIPERWLQGLALAGGWPGALLAQQLWRHKTRKVPFQVQFWAIVALHQVVWAWWLFFHAAG